MQCQIIPVHVNAGNYQWKWRCNDGKQKSDRTFELFYECVEDARSHGANVDLDHVHREISAIDTVKVAPVKVAPVKAAAKAKRA